MGGEVQGYPSEIALHRKAWPTTSNSRCSFTPMYNRDAKVVGGKTRS